MESFLDALLHYTHVIAGNIWWPVIIIMLLSCGLYLTYKTGGIQFSRLGLAIKLMFLSRKKSETANAKGEITPFQALMTALAATVGNGNIAGVATAIVAGGVGAPVWMWITALFGMSTKFSEGMLGLKFRQFAKDGSYSGGAMYYLQDGIPIKKLGRVLAIWFSLAVVFMATFGSGNMAQSNSIALALNTNFGLDFGITSFLLFALLGIILIGGIKRIASFSDKLVPAMIILYMGSGLIIFIMNISLVPEILATVFEAAFSGEAIAGGIAGRTVAEAMRYGVARGTLSSESGIGSCSMPAAAAKGNEAVAQGLVAMMGTFIDTIIVCTMTTFVILSTNSLGTGYDSIELTRHAFSVGLGETFGGSVVSISSAIFGFTTLIGWSYIGEQGFRYLFKNMNVNIYRFVFIVFAGIGALLQGEYLQIVWNFGDIANALMAIPNIIGLFFLGNMIRKETKDYFRRWDNGEIEHPFGN